MYFRFRGNNIQVVRSQPDTVDGKAKSVPIGSINRETLAITDKLRESCTPSELKEIETYVRRYQALDVLKRQHAALTLPEQIAAAAQWFEQARPDDVRDVAEEITAAAAVLRKILIRRGLI